MKEEEVFFITDLKSFKYKSLIISGLATFLGTLDSSIVNVSLPTIGNDLGTTIDLVGWVVLSYAITIIALLMVFGAVSEKKGYRLTYLLGFTFFIVGSILCGISFSIYFLIFARIIQGVGAALMISAGPALITRSFPESERGRGLSIIAMVVSAGLMLGPPLGGFIIAAAGWRWIFFVNFPLGLLGIYFTEKFIRDYPVTNPDKKLGFPSAISLSMGLLILMLSLSLYSRHILGFHYLVGFLLLSAISFALFLYYESVPSSSLIGLDIFKNRVFTYSGLAMFLVFITLSSVTILMPFYLEQIKNLKPEVVGLILMTVPVCGFIMAPLSGYLSDKVQARIITTVGVVLMLIGIILVGKLMVDSKITDIILALIIIGVGMGVFGTPNTSSIMGAARASQLGAASGILATIRSLGITFGVGLAIAIFNFYQNLFLQNGADKADAFIHGYHSVYKFIMVVTFAAIILSFMRGKNLADNKMTN